MGFLAWAGYVSGILALIGIGFAASRAYERFVTRPRVDSLGLADPADLLPALNTLWATPELSRLEIVGYSVHSLYDPINPLVAYAIKRRACVRILMLDPASQFLAERARTEATRANLAADAFLARSQKSIHRTAQRILESVETIKYQNNLKDSDCSVRVYSAPPLYRAVLSNLGAATSSYLEHLELPSRDFQMADPRIGSSWMQREAARAQNWAEYLTKFRSRPYLVDAVLIDLYDTLIDVEPGILQSHQALLAEEAGLPLDQFLEEWEKTRVRSNAGALSTIERFRAILEAKGVSSQPARRLAELEIGHARTAFQLAPKARTFLREISARGYKIALVSNCSESALEAIAATGLHHLVDAQSLSFQTGTLKPNPQIYANALAKLETSGSRAVFIGDGANDELEGARQMGMRTIQARWYARNPIDELAEGASTLFEAARLLDPEATWPLG